MCACACAWAWAWVWVWAWACAWAWVWAWAWADHERDRDRDRERGVHVARACMGTPERGCLLLRVHACVLSGRGCAVLCCRWC